MRLVVLGIYLLLFYNACGEQYGANGGQYEDQGFSEYQKSVEMRFKEMDTLIRQQAAQLQEQSKRIQSLEGIVSMQSNEIHKLQQKTEALENESVNQKKHIKNHESTIDSRQTEIKSFNSKLSKSNNELLSLVKSSVRKPSSDMNMPTNPPTNEAENEDHAQLRQEPGRYSKERRLLIGVTDVSPEVKPTAFYAYLSHHELTINNHHTIIFDTVKTNLNSGYSGYTGIFTVPVEGVYGFLYNIRMGCHTTNALGPFEIIRNNNAEGAVFVDDYTCTNQMTVTGNIIIHANIGDKIYIRSHSAHPMDGNVYSDLNGRTSFAGWLIQEM